MNTASLYQEGSTLVFRNRVVELRFCARTGRWYAMRDRVSDEPVLSGGEIQAPVLLRTNGRTTATRGRRQWQSLIDTDVIGTRTILEEYDLRTIASDGTEHACLMLRTREGNWHIEQCYTMHPDLARVGRTLTVRYGGDDEALLRDVTLRLPPERLSSRSSRTTVEVPGYPTRTGHMARELPLGDDWDRTIGDPFDVGWEPCVAGIASDSPERSIVSWCHNETEPTVLRMLRTDAGVCIRHVAMAADRFTAGHELAWGTQYVEYRHGSWTEALSAYHEWYRSVGIVAPDSPRWAEDMRIYEVFVGYQPLSDDVTRRSRYATLDELAGDLPRIKELGFNTIEIMPRMPFPSYAVIDYSDVDLQYGSSVELKEVVRDAHGMGMRVLLDVIVHGVMDQEAAANADGRRLHESEDAEQLPRTHPLRNAHPDWFVRTETGSPAATYTWAFDHANDEWQSYVIEVFCHYLREYNVDGFRVDALTWNLFPNWGRDLPYRASASVFGSRAMCERLRHELHAIRPDTILYTETTIPVFARAFDFVYNYDIQWIYSALAVPTSRRGFAYTFAHPDERIRASDLGQWLAHRAKVLPPGVRTIHHLDSHDTHEWGRLGQYRSEAFGPAVARAFFALCCFLEGGVMVFTGAEESQPSWYQRMLSLKAETPALRHGRTSYDRTRVGDLDVFCLARLTEEQTVVPVINLGPEVIRAEVRVNLDGLPGAPVSGAIRDLVDGDETCHSVREGTEMTILVPLGPYQARLLEIAG